MNIKQKIYLFSGLLLIIAVFLIGGIVKPLVLEIKQTSILVKEQNEKLIVLEKTDQEYLKQLEDKYNEIKQNIVLVKSGFLNIEQAVDFFVDLENIAFNTSNKLEIEAGEFPIFTLQLLGNFPNMMKFLGWLESSKYFIDVDSIKIRQYSQAPGNITTSLGIKVYTKDKKAYEKGKNLKSD